MEKVTKRLPTEEDETRKGRKKLDPQCEDYWLLDPSVKPLLNVVTFGWIEGNN